MTKILPHPTFSFLKIYRKTSFILILLIGFSFSGLAQDRPFITVWKTDNPGTSEDNQITIPGTGTNYLIEWEEVGNETNNNGSETGTDEHKITFPGAGTYRVKISGDFKRINFNRRGDIIKILDIEQWGDMQWTSFESAFFGCSNLNSTASDTPDLSNVSNLRAMFYEASSFNANISDWNVSNISEMSQMFVYASSFNIDLNSWDVSGVTNMKNMFNGASAFNGDIGNWDVSNVESMFQMFNNAISFNADISNWNVSKVTNMSSMFGRANFFNADIRNWDVSNVTSMAYMFYNAKSFNQDISSWNMSGVKYIDGMFSDADAFNQNLGEWNLTSIEVMDKILNNTSLSSDNYDSTLIGWSKLETILFNVDLGSLKSVFCNAAKERGQLINEHDWKISDQGYCLKDYFVTRWKTDIEGTSNTNQITIPGTGTDYLIEWEQVGNLVNSGSELGTNYHTLTFPTSGVYRVKISGDFTQIQFANSGDKNKLLAIESWGDIVWENMESAFYGCQNFEIEASNIPNLTTATDVSYAFKETNIIGKQLASLNTTNISNMTGMFTNCPNFNANVANWNVSNVSLFTDLFSGAGSFKNKLSAWDISSALDLEGMLDNTALSNYNYGATLKGWSELATLPVNLTLGASNLKYCHEVGRNFLINSKNWGINGDNKDCSNQFITTWKTDNQGISEDNQIEIPGIGTEYFIEWEEVDNETNNSGVSSGLNPLLITFPSAGIYRVKISGDFNSMQFFSSSDKEKILNVEQWGDIEWTTFYNGFRNCTNLNIIATDEPDLRNVTDMNYMFNGATSFNGDISNWDVSNVENMSSMFNGTTSFELEALPWNVSKVKNMSGMFINSAFDGDISMWDVSNVTNMEIMFQGSSFSGDISNWGVANVITMNGMFEYTKSFQGNISQWDVSSVTDMSYMFKGSSFNVDISNWNVSSVADMSNMFASSSFNMDISNWDVSNVVDMSQMFVGSIFDNDLSNWDVSKVMDMGGMFSNSSFKGSIGNWDVSSVTRMDFMFRASPFNSDISNWDVSNVTTMNHMFSEDLVFDQNLSNWDVSNVSNMSRMFHRASSFNSDIRNWNVSNVITMHHMFYQSFSFNHDIGNWNVSNVSDMSGMFIGASNFNQNIKAWDVSNVINMSYMFEGARVFNQDIGGWNISSVTDMSDMLSNSGISTYTYDQILKGWYNFNDLPTNIELGASGIRYCLGGNARNQLINDYGWVINGDYNGCQYDLFITIWQSDNPGLSEDNQVIIPGTGLNYTIVWEEVDNEENNNGLEIGNGHHTITFPHAGKYRVKIYGGFENIKFAGTGDPKKLLEIASWGEIEWSSFNRAFQGCTNLIQTASSAPDLSRVTDMSYMFQDANSYNGSITRYNGSIDYWNVSNVTNMKGMFYNATEFNRDLNEWDVSKVAEMDSMFYEAVNFNGDLTNWDVYSVKDMRCMFNGAIAFNSDISNWDVSNVENMNKMFKNAKTFNQSLLGWDVSQVTDMTAMFCGAVSFNSELSNWDVSNVSKMSSLFNGARSFNQNLAEWNIARTITIDSIFSNSAIDTENYDQTLIGWSKLDSLNTNLSLGADGLQYCFGKTARSHLINKKGWTISGDSENCQSAFISLWDSDNEGESETNQITIPANGANYLVLWENINNTEINGLDSANNFHTITFPSPGNYRVKIYGDFTRINFSDLGDKSKILDIENWGDIKWTSMNTAFAGAENLTISASDSPDLSQVTDISRMFYNAKSLNQDISHWDVSTITNMSDVFHGASSFNQDLSSWDVSNVTKMTRMFANTAAFNQDLNSWNTANVEEMDFMFWDADAFQGNISDWNTAKVNNMWGMFYAADSFNVDISTWDVSAVTNMHDMFRETSAFNKDVSGWNVSNVTDMGGMFYEATAFDQNLGAWDLSNVGSLFEFLTYSGLSPANYDLSLKGWATSGNIPSSIALSAEGLFYCASEEYRQQLIDDYGWNIIGDETCSLALEGTFPAAEATFAEKDTEIYLTFDQEIEEIDFSGIKVTDVSGVEIPLSEIYIDSARLYLMHSGLGSNTYKVEVPENSIISTSGKVNESINWSFTTTRILSLNDRQTVINQVNYPNPFSDYTYIQFNLTQAQPVNMRVYDLKGQVVRVENYVKLGAGEQSVKFERKDLPYGLYHYQLQTNDGSVRGKMLIK